MRQLLFCPFLFALSLMFSGCHGSIAVTGELDVQPQIYPDYCDVTVPDNIAPLNFTYIGNGDCMLRVGDRTFSPKRDGTFMFNRALWKRWMRGDAIEMTLLARTDGRWMAYKPFSITVSHDKIDPYISFRLIPPGYQGWKRMGIYQRNLENYSQTPIVENRLSGENCLNCHTYCQRDPGKMVFHARADFGGTMLLNDGLIEKLNTKTDSTVSALVYPFWHPGGRYIAFSTNVTKQSFFNHDPNRIEVFDTASDVVVYDVEKHSIAWSPLTRSREMFETFPCFSPDGKWLYFCSSKAVDDLPKSYDMAHYGIYRIAFNSEDSSFGDSLECIYDAETEGMSASFPRISPDGRWLAFTRHGYGNFSIWHKDADIWMTDLQSGESGPAVAMNSDDVDSYHSWSGNSRWMVFSSRRDDGLYTRLYISHINSDGEASKAFMLPQRDPLNYYKKLMFSYNLPEFMCGKVATSPHRISDKMRSSDGIQVTAAF